MARLSAVARGECHPPCGNRRSHREDAGREPQQSRSTATEASRGQTRGEATKKAEKAGQNCSEAGAKTGKDDGETGTKAGQDDGAAVAKTGQNCSEAGAKAGQSRGATSPAIGKP